DRRPALLAPRGARRSVLAFVVHRLRRRQAFRHRRERADVDDAEAAFGRVDHRADVDAADRADLEIRGASRESITLQGAGLLLDELDRAAWIGSRERVDLAAERALAGSHAPVARRLRSDEAELERAAVTAAAENHFLALTSPRRSPGRRGT